MLIQYFLPYIAATAASLVIFANKDRKLLLMAKDNIDYETSIEKLNLNKNILICLELVRRGKYSIINVAITTYFLLSFLCIILFFIQNLNFIKQSTFEEIISFIGFCQIGYWLHLFC